MAHCKVPTTVEFGDAIDRTGPFEAPDVQAPPALLSRLGAGGQRSQRTDMVKKSRAQYEAKYRAGVPTIVGRRSVPLAALAAPAAVAGL